MRGKLESESEEDTQLTPGIFYFHWKLFPIRAGKEGSSLTD